MEKQLPKGRTQGKTVWKNQKPVSYTHLDVYKRQELEVVLTGRNPDEKLIGLADYVSEIRKIKHPFDREIRARRGIEY